MTTITETTTTTETTEEGRGVTQHHQDVAQYRNIMVERRGRVGLVTLNRPSALNALN